MTKKVLCVVGTRPEVVKMAPIILLLREDKDLDLVVLSVAQHREMLDQMFAAFGIESHFDLNIMKKNQSLPELTARLPLLLDGVLDKIKPDIILGQGDTTTAFMMSLASFYRKIPFGHVEAGLRTGNIFHPYPEEMNRKLISHLSTLHFAPTGLAKENLIKEGVPEESIFVTGNTVVDSLELIIDRHQARFHLEKNKRLILVTAHRRENIGEPLVQICRGVRQIAENNSDVQVLFPVHPNPNVSKTVFEELQNHPRITLSEPLSYESFVPIMKKAYLILTDSGGIQEEAASLNVPVLVLRNVTERPEGVLSGVSRVIGASQESIVESTQQLLDSEVKYRQMILQGTSPYGDGKAAQRIIEIIKTTLYGNEPIASLLSAEDEIKR